MKKLARIVFGCVGLLILLFCSLPPEAGIRITSEGKGSIEFSGYYGSEVTEVTEVHGVTAASYKVKVNTESDHIKAAFTKKDRDEIEMRIRLFYRGVVEDITIKEFGDTAYIDHKIGK